MIVCRLNGIGSNRLFWLIALVVGDGLLLTPAGGPLRAMGSLVLLFMPGVVLLGAIGPQADILLGWIVGIGLSYTLMMGLGVFLPYVPSFAQFVVVVVVIHVLVLGSLWRWRGRTGPRITSPGRVDLFLIASVLLILLAATFRFANLGYSEFQGDEVKVLVPAARALEGHHDAFVVERKKGPGEALPPMFLWRLSGTVNEGAARLPIATASLLAVPTVFLLGRKMLGTRAALAAAWLLSLNGLMVGFGRVVQYQSLVVWMSALALLCAWLCSEERRRALGRIGRCFFGKCAAGALRCDLRRSGHRIRDDPAFSVRGAENTGVVYPPGGVCCRRSTGDGRRAVLRDLLAQCTAPTDGALP